MEELDDLVEFMRRGKRSKITLCDYEKLTNKNFTFAKKVLLINQIQKSGFLNYQKQEKTFYVVLAN